MNRKLTTFVLGMVFGSMVIAAVALFVWWAGFIPTPQPRSEYKSIAVLPLERVGADTNEITYLAQAISEQLTTQLTRLGVPMVPWIVSRRYSTLTLPAARIAADLKADALVLGEVEKVDDLIRGNVSLVDGITGESVWDYEFEERLSNLIFVQKHIAKEIGERIKGKLTGEETATLESSITASGEAYELHMRGWETLYSGKEGASEKAREFFEKALVTDPDFAEAYIGLGNVFYRLPGAANTAEAISNYAMALRLNPRLTKARQGLVKAHHQQGTLEECLKQTLDIPPETPEFEQLILRSEAYIYGGIADKAVPLLRQILEIDPDNEEALWNLTFACYRSSQLTKAIEVGERYVMTYGDDVFTHNHIAAAQLVMGNFDEAIRLLENLKKPSLYILALAHEKAGHEELARTILLNNAESQTVHLRSVPDDHNGRANLAWTLARLGDLDGYHQQRRHLEKAAADNPTFYWDLGLTSALVGMHGEAVEFLRRAPANGYLNYVGMHDEGLHLQGLESLLDDPGFQELANEFREDLDRLRSTY